MNQYKKVILIFILFNFFSIIMISNAQEKIMDAKTLMSMKRLEEFQISPDGNWIVFAVSIPDIEANKKNSEIFKIKIDGSELIQLTKNDYSYYNPRWSPDGKKIAFISSKEGKPQIFTMTPDGKNMKKITNCPNGVSNMAWSPDGKYFSFTTDVKIGQTIQEKYPKLTKAKARIYDKLPVRHWDEWKNEYNSHLFIIPTEGGKEKDLMPDEPYDCPVKPFGGSEQIAWSPDGKEIAYTSKKVENYVQSTNTDIFLLTIGTTVPKNITEIMYGADFDPKYSPDGNWIAFHSQQRAGFESDKIRLMLYNRITGEISELSANIDQWIENFVWSPDSKSIYFSVTEKGCYPIYSIGVPDGRLRQITRGWFNDNMGIDITPDGKSLVFGREDMLHPTDIYKVTLNDEVVTQLTFLNKDILKELKAVKVQQQWIFSTDKERVHCWVVLPPDFDKNKKYPMITFCQGGPQSMISQRFHYRWNYYLMASHGYVLLLPNRRGLPGFGQRWNDAISKDWGGMAMKDILAATDAFANEVYVDRDRLAAVGASAGGYAVFWLEGNHEGRFKAFVSHCGVFNFESMYGSTEELWFPNWEYGGPYWEAKNKEQYEKFSPHKFADKWNTPILISTGEYDFRVPYTQSLEAFTVAQVKKIPSKLIIFPEESHFISHAQEFILWDSEFFEFLDKYCKSK